MFVCDACKKVAGPKVHPIFLPKSGRDVTYYKVDEVTGEKVVAGTGWEVQKEIKVCPKCAGQAETPEQEMEDRTSHWFLLAQSHYAHVSKCPGVKTHKDREGNKITEPCAMCERIMESFKSFPLHGLSVATSQPMVKEFKNSFASVAIENLIDRTRHNIYPTHQGQRAKADVFVGIGLFQWYEAQGGKL